MESKLKLNFFQIHFFLFCYEADREALILQHTMRPINISMFWSPWSLAVVTSLTLIYSYTGPSFVQGSSNPGNIKTHRPPECVKCDQFPVCVLILKDVSGPTTVLLSPLLPCCLCNSVLSSHTQTVAIQARLVGGLSTPPPSRGRRERRSAWGTTSSSSPWPPRDIWYVMTFYISYHIFIYFYNE